MKKYLLLLLLLPVIQAEAQTQLQHEPKAYVDANQNYYQQASLPVYLFISHSSDPSSVNSLKPEGTEEKSPIYLDGHGTHYFRHKDNEEHQEILFAIHADGMAPQSKHQLQNAHAYTHTGHTYFAPGLEVELPATDEMSGLEATYVSVNQAPYRAYEEALRFDSAGEYSLQYYSVDRVGNAEKVRQLSFRIDETAPISQLKVEGSQADKFVAAQTRLLLSAEDAGAGLAKIMFSIDGGKEVAYTDALYLNQLAAGEHTLRYYAQDRVGNTEEAREWKFVLDRSAPQVQQEILGKSYEVNGKTYFSGETKLKITASDDASGVQAIYYSVNGSEFQAYTEPFVISREEKKISIRAYAVDKVNNEGSKQSGQLESEPLAVGTMDFSGPELGFSLEGPVFQSRDSLFVSANTQISLEGKDAGSGLNLIRYTIDGGTPLDYTQTFRLSESGVHQIRVEGFDNLLNTSEQTYTVITDLSGPEIFPRLSIAPIGKLEQAGKQLDVYPAHVVLFLSATDQTAGFDKIYYRINGGEEKEYTGIIRNFPAGGAVNISLRSIDLLGNEQEQEFNFAIESKEEGLVSKK